MKKEAVVALIVLLSLILLAVSTVVGCTNPEELATLPATIIDNRPTVLIPTPVGSAPVHSSLQRAPVVGATGYELWLDTNADFSTPQKFTGIVASIFTPDELILDTVYYWQVRAITSTGIGAWSSPSAFIPTILPQP